MDLSFDVYYPLETGNYVTGNFITAYDDGAAYHGIHRLARNHNVLIATYDPCDLLAHCFTSGTGTYNYQETDKISDALEEPIWSAELEEVCKDFTNIVVEAVLEAPDDDIDVRAIVGTLGGGTGAAQTVTGGAAAAAYTWTIAQGSADPILVYLDAIADTDEDTLYIYSIRISYEPLATPLTAGPTAGTLIYPLDADLVDADEPSSTWIPTVMGETCAALCTGRPARWGWADLFYVGKGALFSTNNISSYVHKYSFTIDAKTSEVGIRILAQAGDASDCSLKLEAVAGGVLVDTLTYHIADTAPDYSDWEDAGNLDVRDAQPTEIRVYLRSGPAAGPAAITYLHGLIATELW